ncbi:MAG: cysteine desulfurase [Lentisphaerae bacterium]|jgi:cysteine desulfurase|nr:cysteine desulfurase [Lentisphaerota bacterium]
MIYWDHNSTTPCAPEVVEAMRPYWNDDFGNPASSHIMGRRAAAAVNKARQQVATLANALPEEIVFTSGATESNNLLFLGVLLSPLQERRQIAVSAIEHKSVLEPARLLQERGFELIELPVDKNGAVDLEAAARLITPRCLLVSVQAANNEIGTIQPIAELARLAHDNGAYFHSDAAQALGRIPFDVLKINCDFASFSAHKLYGPKGIGALFVRGGARCWPWVRPFRGGGQEADLRPGTLNVPAIVGFGEACKIAAMNLDKKRRFLDELTTRFRGILHEKIPTARVITPIEKSLPGTLSVIFPKVNSDVLVANCKTICISRGSACNGAVGVSHVINLIVEGGYRECVVRISFGSQSSLDGLDLFINTVHKLLENQHE